MARSSPVTTQTTISSVAQNALIADYMSQTDTSDQDLAGKLTIVAGKSLEVDTISETTVAAGVTLDGVKMKDSIVYTDTVSEKTGAAGVTIDSVVLKDGEIDFAAGKRPKANFIYMNPSAAPAATEGHIYYDSTAKKLLLRNDSSWLTIPAAGGGGSGGALGITTYTIYRSGATYYATSDDGTVVSSGSDYYALIDALITADGIHFHHKKGTYVLDDLITVDKNYVKFTADPYTIFDVGANGRILLASAGQNPISTNLYGLFGFEFDGANRSVTIDGQHATYPFIDSVGFTTLHRNQHLKVHDLHFYDWRDSPSVLHLFNLETSLIHRNTFGGAKGQATLAANDGAFIVLDTDDYNAGNVYVGENMFDAWATADLWYSHILIRSTDGKEYNNVVMFRNHAVNIRETSCAVKHIVLSADGGALVKIESINERFEGVDIWDVLDWTSYFKRCRIALDYGFGNGSTKDPHIIDPDGNWRNQDMKIHDNMLGSLTGKTILDLAANGGTGYETLFYNNHIYGTAGTVVGNANNIFEWGNKGYGVLGRYQSQSGAWADPSGFARNGSEVTVYNSTAGTSRKYCYSNSAWRYEDLT